MPTYLKLNYYRVHNFWTRCCTYRYTLSSIFFDLGIIHRYTTHMVPVMYIHSFKHTWFYKMFKNHWFRRWVWVFYTSKESLNIKVSTFANLFWNFIWNQNRQLLFMRRTPYLHHMQENITNSRTFFTFWLW